jgi:hypothetical protein
VVSVHTLHGWTENENPKATDLDMGSIHRASAMNESIGLQHSSLLIFHLNSHKIQNTSAVQSVVMCLDDVLCFACGACCTSCCVGSSDQTKDNQKRRSTHPKTTIVYVAPVVVTRGPPPRKSTQHQAQHQRH